MKETILNIYLIIEKDQVIGLKAKAYESEKENDDDKIAFLKNNARQDLNSAYNFDAPQDKWGNCMSYKRFSKFEKQGLHFQLFENIFTEFDVPENPLICVTPIVDGEFFGQ